MRYDYYQVWIVTAKGNKYFPVGSNIDVYEGNVYASKKRALKRRNEMREELRMDTSTADTITRKYPKDATCKVFGYRTIEEEIE